MKTFKKLITLSVVFGHILFIFCMETGKKNQPRRKYSVEQLRQLRKNSTPSSPTVRQTLQTFLPEEITKGKEKK
jgi:hypothetical protein